MSNVVDPKPDPWEPPRANTAHAASIATGATGEERIYDGYPDVALEMVEHRTFDDSIQLVEYRPRVLEHPPLHPAGGS